MDQLSLFRQFDQSPALSMLDVVDAVVLPSAQLPAVPARPMLLTSRQTVTLADVMAFVSADPVVTTAQRRDRLCAMRTLARILGKDAQLISALPADLAKVFKAVVPAAHTISDSRWGNIRSRILAALIQAGIPAMAGRSNTCLSPGWARFAGGLETRGKLGLSRFMRFCTDLAIEPEQVDDTTLNRFRSALDCESLLKTPHGVHRTACDQWNKAVAAIPGWETRLVAVPRNPRHYSFDWSAFPESLTGDVEAFLARASKADPFADAYVRPQRPATIALQRAQIRQMASHLVQSGIPINQVSRLAILAEPANAKTILLAAHRRLGDRASHLHGMAMLLKVIAVHWNKAPLGAVATLAGYTSQAAPLSRSMTVKNRERLQQFDNPEQVQALLDLPRRVFRELKQSKQHDRPAALRALSAMAIECLIAMPMRIHNLASLDLSRHIVMTGQGRRLMHVVIPGEETKTGEPYEVTVPADTAALLTTFRAVYRPLLSSLPSTLLFPNMDGEVRNETAFSVSLSRFIRRETGLIMNVHLFRHFAVSLYLRDRPEDLETARRILGHKSIATTTRFYADIKTKACFRRYDAVIDDIRTRPLAGKGH